MSQSLQALFAARADRSSKPFNVVEFVNTQNAEKDVVGALAAQPNTLSVGVESFGEDNLSRDKQESLAAVYDSMHSALQTLGFENYGAGVGMPDGMADRVRNNQVVAATMGLIGASNENSYKKQLLACAKATPRGDERGAAANLSGPYGTVATVEGASLENYNEKSQRDFRVVTAGYNLESARQDLFAETLYPTTVVNAAEGGIVQVLPYVAILKDVFHKSTGQRFDTQEVNLIEAYRSPSILDDVSTALIPIVDPDGANAHLFMEGYEPKDIVTEQGDTLKTAPLKIGETFDLIGISNRSMLIAGNMLDLTDTIDPAMRLKAIYVKVGTSIVRLMTERMATAVFQPALVGDTRGAQLVFDTEDLNFNGETTAIDMSRPAFSDELRSRNWAARLNVRVFGKVSLSKGDCSITATEGKIDRIWDVESRDYIDLASGAGKALVDSIGKIEIAGYELDARFTNTNRRQRGHLIQTRALQFRYAIPMHAPITLPLSTMDEQGPGEVVKALTVVTNVRNSSNAVTRALNYVAQLREAVGSGYDRPKFGAVEGVLSAMMRPVYRYAKLDMPTAIDSIRSGDRWNDVCSAILNTVRGLLFPAYRDSNLQAVFQTITGNINERPKFIFATDMEIANYLMTSGDNRTLGAQLKYDIVATNNEAMDGKLLVIPTRENPVENDILNWGQFFYVSTLVADLPISRNGQISREIAAVPFNLHVNNIPFAIEIDIVGLKDVMSGSLYNSKL